MSASHTVRPLHRVLSPEACFLLGVSALCTVALAVLAAPGYWVKPQVVAPALTVDLALGVPALGYLFLVRRRRASHLLLVPLFALGLGLARWWIPEPHRDTAALRLVLLGLDAAVTAFVATRVGLITRRYRRYRVRLSAPDAMGRALAEALGRRLGGLIHTEMAVLWYAVTGWGRRSRPRPGTSDFGYHRAGAYPALLGVILMVIAVETGVAHLLLGLWSAKAAWASSALGLYSAIWLIGDYRAARMNPISVSDAGLELSTGLRWRTSVSWRQVRRIVDGDPDEPGVRMTLIGKPDFWLELEEPVSVRGAFGLERRARFLGLRSDEAKALRAAVADRLIGA